MKLCVCLMIFPMMLVASPALSQQHITMEVRNASLDRALQELGATSGYYMLYKSEDVAHVTNLNFTFTDISVQEALEKTLAGTGLTFEVEDNTIIIYKATRQAPARRSISGRVTDEDGAPLAGVTIVVRDNPTTGTITDVAGRYVLAVGERPGLTLQFSFVGYQKKDEVVGSRTTINVRMVQDVVKISDVVVTGYQTISRERSAGSFASISGGSLAEKASLSGSILESLEGLSTGLSINHADGEEKMIMRGINSVNANKEPLYVVDGVPMSSENVELMVNENDIATITVLKDATAASIWGAQAANGVIVIITKRGGDTNKKLKVSYNGSFTYEGYADYDYMQFMSSGMFIKNAQEIFDPEEYTWSKVSNESFSLGQFQKIMPHELPMYQALNGDISNAERDRILGELASRNNRDQIKEYLQQATLLTRHTVSFTGGTDTYSIYGSLSYDYNQGNPTRTEDDRGLPVYDPANRDNTIRNVNKYALNLRQDFRIAKWLSLDLTTNISYVTTRNGNSLWRTNSNSLLPYMMLRDENGNNISHADLIYSETIRTGAEERSGLNLDYVPLDEMDYGFNRANSLNARINAGLTVKLMEGLQFEGRYQFQRNNTKSEIFEDEKAFEVRYQLAQFTVPSDGENDIEYLLPNRGGRYTERNAYENNWTVRNQFSFNRAFCDGMHHVTALAGMEIRANKSNSLASRMWGYNTQTMLYGLYDAKELSSTGNPNPALAEPGVGEVTLNTRPFGLAESEYRYVSLYANAAYTFNSRYSVNGSVRVDQSNLFGSDASVQWKPIWSAGVAWNIGQEEFMSGVNAVNRLNLRLSYGLGGNSPNPGMGGPYDILDASNNSSFENSGYTIIRPANNQLRWEKTRTFNVGVDVAVLNSRLSASLDVYDKKTTDLLGWLPLNATTGWTNALGNLGTITNKGFELSLTSHNIRNRNFNWITTLNLTYNKNKVVEVYEESTRTASSMVYGRYVAGYSAASIFAYQWAGLDKNGNPQVYNRARDEDGNLTETIVSTYEGLTGMESAKYMGTAQPPWYGGLTNSFRYKDFELSFMFVFNLGHVMRNDVNQLYTGRLSSNIHKDFDKRWRKSGDEATTNVPAYISNSDYSSSSRYIGFYSRADINIVSASYIKLRDLSLSYSLPKNLCARISADAVKVRLQASNLFYWAKNNEGIDPEAHSYSYGTRVTRYGPSYSVSLSINFK